ncbi:unnamed protein product [Gadus morhua 'NCC']
MKRRFHVLHGEIRLTPERASTVITVPFYTTSASGGTFHSQTMMMMMMMMMMAINMTMNLAVWSRVDWHLGITLKTHFRRNLEHLFKKMKANWAEFNLATHGLGPYVLETTCVLIDSCLAEKLKLLKIDK